ncbi:MAG: ABC transporter substrate-binding protein [Eubacteriales bacterium]|nr:ABC transporter substrate-binding protein [Eubacteriales bacterium]MDD4324424.1 ABC transporter substrate-binding protein [Eubacteriales bacterium]MDD4540560.1 ABC transporter substrate-binding protein [Eubacteriales bacterium]
MNRKSKVLSLFIALLTIFSITACTADAEAPANEPTQPLTGVPTETETPETYVFTDSAGREVLLPSNIERIVPSGPLSQQLLLTIAGDLLVALTNDLSAGEAYYIGEEYQALPVIGQFFGSQNMNMEELARLEPQVVIDIGEPKGNIAEDMDTITLQTGIPAIFIEADLEKSGEAYRTLGKLLGREEKGAALGNYCDRVFAGAKAKMAEIPESERISFAYLQGESGLNAISRGTYHALIMDMLGKNVVEVESPSSRGSGDEINMEQLIMWDPEIIFFASGSVYDEVELDPAFSSLSAVQNGKYYEVPGLPYNWLGTPPSVNRYIGLEWMAQILYPDIFTEDFAAIAQEYYKLFYDYDLSSEEYADMMANSTLKD